jgi:hypothetical protein
MVTSQMEVTYIMDNTLIPASAFKAKCLDLFDKLAARKIKRLTVTKRGKAVAVLTPPDYTTEEKAALFGCMKGRMVAPKNFDFTTPVFTGAVRAAKGVWE